MADLTLNSATGDVLITGNNLTLTSGSASIAQDLTIRLKTFLGEWFLDQRVGMPHYQSLLVKNPNMNVVRSILRQAILKTPGVLSIQKLAFDYEENTRALSVDLAATLQDGGTLVFDEELIIG